jgi:hypothetical protein
MTSSSTSGQASVVPPKPRIEQLRKRAKDLLKAHKRGEAHCCRVLRQLRQFHGKSDADVLAGSVSLVEVQYALAMHYGFKSWKEYTQQVCEMEGRDEDALFAPYRRVPFRVEGASCSDDGCAIHPDLAALRFQIEQVHGTSNTVAVGERYTITGEYELAGSDLYSISIAVCSKAFGAGEHLQPGAGRFNISTEVLALVDGAPNALGIVVKNETTGRCGIVRWVTLEDPDAEAQQ